MEMEGNGQFGTTRRSAGTRRAADVHQGVVEVHSAPGPLHGYLHIFITSSLLSN
jgi:hypothetical protein